MTEMLILAFFLVFLMLFYMVLQLIVVGGPVYVLLRLARIVLHHVRPPKPMVPAGWPAPVAPPTALPPPIERAPGPLPAGRRRQPRHR